MYCESTPFYWICKFKSHITKSLLFFEYTYKYIYHWASHIAEKSQLEEKSHKKVFKRHLNEKVDIKNLCQDIFFFKIMFFVFFEACHLISDVCK